MDEFRGVIGPSWRESTAWWPPEPTAPAGAPNVLVVVLDDVGFAQLGCYGSDIETPNIDRLAAGGLRYRNFPTTPPSPPPPAPPPPRPPPPGLPAHRPQPPLGRRRPGHRPGHRLPRLRRPHPPLGWDAAGDA